MQELVAPVTHIKFEMEVALDQQLGSQPLPFPGMDSEQIRLTGKLPKHKTLRLSKDNYHNTPNFLNSYIFHILQSFLLVVYIDKETQFSDKIVSRCFNLLFIVFIQFINRIRSSYMYILPKQCVQQGSCMSIQTC